jgi:fibronectin-binding autotransporter adhesin
MKMNLTKSFFSLKNNLAGLMVGVAALLAFGQAKGADEFWRTDGTTGGTWVSNYWNIGSPNATGGTGWTNGNNAVFTANSTLTFATATVGNITVSNSSAVAITTGGTLTLAGVRTFDIESGSTLTWASQSQSTAAGNEGSGLILNGGGILNWGSPGNNARIDGAYTINAGTIIMSGKYGFGVGPLTINGGTIQSSGGNAYLASSLTLGGDFTFTGTGGDTYGMAITNTGATARNITNSTTSGSRILSGQITGNAGVGLNFWGSGSGVIYIGNATNANSFSGPITINGAEVGFANDGSFGAVPASVMTNAIVVDGGRLTVSDTSGNGVSYMLNSNRGIQVGATAGTSISVKSGGSLTYFGTIADNPTDFPGILVKQGSGTLSLGGANIFSGDIGVNNGTLQLTNGNNRLPTTAILNIGQSASANLGTFDLNGNNQQIVGLNSTPGTYAGASKNTVTSSTTPATLTISGSGNYAFGDGSAANSGIIIGPVTVVMNGSGTETLGDANSYTGNTIVQQGTLVLDANDLVSSSPLIEIDGGATFDVSAFTSGLTLDNSQTLKAGGTTSAGTIATGAGAGLALGPTSSLQFSAFNGTTAPLTISGSGAITLAIGNVVTVTNVSGSPFTAGDYKLISTNSAGGIVSGAAPSAVTVSGNGVVGGATSSLVISNAELYLHVAGGASSPATNSISFGGTTANIGVVGVPNTQYELLTTTNLTNPPSLWLPIQTNTTSGTGVTNFIDLNATNHQQFYRTKQLP